MYRTIDTATWHDPKFRALPPPGKLLFLYLITNPHAHLCGIYYLPTVTILHESGVKPEAIDTLWHTLSGAGMVSLDKELEVIWVRNMFRYQGCGEKHERSAASQLRTLHNSPLIKDFLKTYPAVKRYFRDRVSDRASQFGTQEQEQEKEQDSKAAPSADEVGEDGKPITWETVYRAYPKHVEPEPARQEIAKAVRYLRKDKGIPTPWAWLLGTVRKYADARRQIEEKRPGSDQYVTSCGRWMKRKRYLEDPADWEKESARVREVGANGMAVSASERKRTAVEQALERRIAQ